MQGRPQEYMSVGIVHFMAFPEVMKGDGAAADTLKALCKNDYFQVFEVTRIRDAAERRDAIETVRSCGRTVTFGAQPALLGAGLSLCDANPLIRQAAVDMARDCLKEATEWGATSMAVLAGPDPGEEGRAFAKAMLCASLKEICEFSRRMRGPALTLEVFDRSEIGKNSIIGPTCEAAEVAAKVQPLYLSFGLLVDQGHLPLLNETPAEAIKAAGAYLRHVHIGNCVRKAPRHPAYGDNHPIFGIPEGENGVAELAAFLKALLDAGYIGKGKKSIVSFEIKPFGAQKAADVIANATETLDAAWGAL